MFLQEELYECTRHFDAFHRQESVADTDVGQVQSHVLPPAANIGRNLHNGGQRIQDGGQNIQDRHQNIQDRHQNIQDGDQNSLAESSSSETTVRADPSEVSANGFENNNHDYSNVEGAYSNVDETVVKTFVDMECTSMGARQGLPYKHIRDVRPNPERCVQWV